MTLKRTRFLFLMIVLLASCGSDNSVPPGSAPPTAYQPAGYPNSGGNVQWNGPYSGGQVQWGAGGGGAVNWQGPRGGSGTVVWGN